jgi:hypothetical protein
VNEPFHLDIGADRWVACIRTIPLVNADLTDAVFKMQVRAVPDVGGDPLVDLDTVTTSSAEGVRLIDVTTGTIAAHITAGRLGEVPKGINPSTGVPYATTDSVTLSRIGIRIACHSQATAIRRSAVTTCRWCGTCTSRRAADQGQVFRRRLHGPGWRHAMTLNNSGLLAACAIPLQALPAVALSTPIEKPPFHLDFTTEMPSGAVLERASTATYFDAAGVLQTAAIDAARFDHDPKTLAAKGLLHEPVAATNALLQSTPSTAGVWGSFGACTLTTNQPGKAGATSATKVTPQALGVSLYRIRQNYEWVGDQRAISADIKSAGWQWICIWFNDFTLRRVWFDIINGVVGATQGGGDIAGEIEDIGGGVFRCTAKVTTDTASGLVEICASGGNGAANLNADPNGVDAFVIEDIQVDVGTKPTSRVITTAAPVTRAPGVLTLTIPAGVEVIRVTHDDGSYTELEVSAGPFVVPALARPWIKTIVERPPLPALADARAVGSNVQINDLNGPNVYVLNGVTNHYFPRAEDWIRVNAGNWFVNLTQNALTEGGPGFAMQTAFSIQLGDGTWRQITWNGGDPDVTIASGGDAWSDWCFVGQTAGWKKIRTWRVGEGATGGHACPIAQFGCDTANGEATSAIPGDINRTLAGGIVHNLGDYRLGPQAIIGLSGVRSDALFGDSLTIGSLDAGPGPDRGMFARAINTRWVYGNYGIGNDRAYAIAAAGTKRAALGQHYTHIWLGHAGNDLSLSHSAATIQADVDAYAGNFAGKTIILHSPPPFGVTSANGFVAPQDQVPPAFDGERIALSTARRAGIVGYTFVEAADAVESARNSGKWRVDLGALTTDGIHGNALCNTTLGTFIAPQL